MRPSPEIPLRFRVVVLASGLALLAGACGGSQARPAARADAQPMRAATPRLEPEARPAGPTAERIAALVAGPTRAPTAGQAGWRWSTPHGRRAAEPALARVPAADHDGDRQHGGHGNLPHLSANGYNATYYGTSVSFANGFVNLTGVPAEEIVVTPKAGVPAVDVTGSYSVQAWVKLTNVGGFQTVVSGEGFDIASFFLQKRIDLGGAWFFTTQAGDSISSANCISPPLQPVDGGPAQNPVVVVANTLYHLVATRDAAGTPNPLRERH